MKIVLAGMTTLASASVLVAGCTGSVTSSETTSTTSATPTSSTTSTASSNQHPSEKTSLTTTKTVQPKTTKSAVLQSTGSAPTTGSTPVEDDATSPTAKNTSAASSATPTVYRLTPKTLAGLKLPIKESQIALLSERLGKPKTVNKAHCSFAAGIGKAGKHHKWGDLILATDPFEKPKQYTYWYLTGSNLPKNLKPSFKIGTGGSVKALKKTYPKITHDVADPSFGGYLFGPGLPVWFELDSEVVAVQSDDIGCLRSE